MSESFSPPMRFNVSQIRVAACCPRIFVHDIKKTRINKLLSPYVTKIWQKGTSDQEPIVTAGGTLFHNSIEKFNRLSARSEDIVKIFEHQSKEMMYRELMQWFQLNCLNRETFLKMSPASMEAFSDCVSNYMDELLDMVMFAKTKNLSASEIKAQLLADQRKYVDATFRVGPNKKPVHITGELDYVFFDWRFDNHRILDYKLTPSGNPNHDLFQVTTYALMHHLQHQTTPDVGILYLHPKRQIVVNTWSQVNNHRHIIYDLLASMVAWTDNIADQKMGLHPPGNIGYCSGCPWNRDGYCEKTLGPKNEGERIIWHKNADNQQLVEPEIKVVNPPEIFDDHLPNEFDDEIDPIHVEEKIHHEFQSASLIPGKINDEFISIPASILNTHVAVVGAAGSGKTWMAKIIVEEAIRSGVPVLAIDPQGDIVQFLHANNRSEVPAEYHPHYDEFHAKKEVRIFTPGTSHAQRVCLSPLRLPSLAELSGITNPDRRQEEYEGMLAATAGNLISLADVGGDTESQKTLVFKLLKFLGNETATPPQLSDIIAGLAAPDHCGISEPDLILKKSEREKLFRRLNNFLEGPAAALFSKGITLDLSQMITPEVQGKVPLNIIYLNALHSDQEKQFFVSMLAAEVYRWMVTSSANSGQTNLLFYIDEARDYIPAGIKDSPAKQALIRLFTQGRKYGVGCLLCTQSPRSVDYNVFGNCSSKFIGRMEASQDIDRIGEWFSTSGPIPSWIKERNGAPKGTFVGRWPGMNDEHDGLILKTRQLYSLHRGAWPPHQLEQEYHQ